LNNRTLPIHHAIVFAALLALTANCATRTVAENTTPAGRRAALQRKAAGGIKAIPDLVTSLDDENMVVRRTAVRLLIQFGEPARDSLTGALDNSDELVRRVAFRTVLWPLTPKSLPIIEKALKDSSPAIRQTAVKALVTLRPRTEIINGLITQAAGDADPVVRARAAKAQWPFYKKPYSIRDRTDWDHDVRILKTIPLPKDNWRFKLDPKRIGHKKGWYKNAYKDSKWATIKIEQAWQKSGYKYIGVAWYRRLIDLPQKPGKSLAVELRFLGVDECAWVWVNGQYAGQHDIGPSGWNQPFTLDITKYLKWGKKNRITVRAMNTRHAGGIWRPVQIEVLH